MAGVTYAAAVGAAAVGAGSSASAKSSSSAVVFLMRFLDERGVAAADGADGASEVSTAAEAGGTDESDGTERCEAGSGTDTDAVTGSVAPEEAAAAAEGGAVVDAEAAPAAAGADTPTPRRDSSAESASALRRRAASFSSVGSRLCIFSFFFCLLGASASSQSGVVDLAAATASLPSVDCRRSPAPSSSLPLDLLFFGDFLVFSFAASSPAFAFEVSSLAGASSSLITRRFAPLVPSSISSVASFSRSLAFALRRSSAFSFSRSLRSLRRSASESSSATASPLSL